MSGVDKFSLLNGELGGECVTTIIINDFNKITDDKVYDAIRQLLLLGEDKIPPLLTFSFENIILPHQIVKEAGGNIGDMIIDIATSVGAIFYYDVEGRFVVEDGLNYIDATNKGSQWDFTTSEAEYLGGSAKFATSNIFNRVIVINANILEGAVISHDIKIDNLTNPLRTQLIGIRTKIITDNIIVSADTSDARNALLKTRAEYELKVLSMLQTSVTINSIPLYHIDVNNIITLTDKNYNFDKTRLLIHSMSIPLSVSGQMTLQATNVDNLNISNI